MEAYNRPVCTKHVSASTIFQDGDSALYQNVNSAGRLGDLSGSHGCLSAHPNPYQFPAVPPFCCGGDSLYVPGATIRSLPQPMDFYTRHERHHDVSPVPDFVDNGSLLRRHSRQTPTETGLGTRQRLSAGLPTETGLHCQQREVRPAPQTMLRPFGDELRFPHLHGRPHREADRQPLGSGAGSARCQPYYSQRHRPDGRSLPGSSGAVTFRPTALTAPAVGRDSLVLTGSTMGHHGADGAVFSTGLRALDRPSLASVASTYTSTCPHSVDLHRRLVRGMGSTPASRFHCGQRNVDSRGTGQTHQRTRDDGGAESPTGVDSGLGACVGTNLIRQLDGGGIYQQTGRHQVGETLPVVHHNLAVCATAFNRPTSPPHSGETERASRRPFSTSGFRHRVDPGPSSVPVAIGAISPHDVRSFRHAIQQSADEIRLAISRPDGGSRRRSIRSLGGQRCVRLSSNSTDTQSSDQTGEFCWRNDPCSPPGSTQGLVLHASRPPPAGTSANTGHPGSTETTPLRGLDGRPSISASACLQIIRRALKAKGFSSPAVVRIVGSRRKSTLTVYDKKWSRLASWCAKNNLHPLRLSSPELANFFIELFEEDKLQPITIKGYRAAISRVYKLTGASWSPGTDMFLSELMKNFSLERPTTSRLLPKWSLEIVLDFLNSDEFEPLQQANLLRISQKAAFLLTLATAGRISEIHALSAAADFLTFNQDGSVTLLTNANFIAKNRLPDNAPRPITVLPCAEMLNCPVRALNCYLDATHEKRDPSLALWVNPSTMKKATKNLISSWIRITIKEAYEWTAAHREVLTADTALTQAVTAEDSASSTAGRAGNSSTMEGPQSKNGHESRMTQGNRENNTRRAPAPAQQAIPSVEHRAGVMPGVRIRDCPRQTAGTDQLRSEPDLSRPAHELRAIAASISYHRGTRLQDLLQAVGWQSRTTFGRFYLRQLPVSDPGTGALTVPGQPGAAPIP